MFYYVKRAYGGRISFNDPVLKPVFYALDQADRAVRFVKQRGDLPPYSIRVRTNGIQGEFGGYKFQSSAKVVLERLQRLGLDFANKRVLDVGCSCGRMAFALRGQIGAGEYWGMDIDAVSLGWAEAYFRRKDDRFRFKLIDVYSDVYNASKAADAAQFQFPFSDKSFDVVFAYSLFTHLLEEEFVNYVRNAYRVLQDGGSLAFSCFAVDGDLEGTFLANSVKDGNTIIYSRESPRKANAFDKTFIEAVLKDAGFQSVSFDRGIWRTPNNLGGADQDFYRCVK